jgi:hypothetical protein
MLRTAACAVPRMRARQSAYSNETSSHMPDGSSATVLDDGDSNGIRPDQTIVRLAIRAFGITESAWRPAKGGQSWNRSCAHSTATGRWMPERASARSNSDHHDVLPIDATHCSHVLPPGRDGEDWSRRPVRRPRRPQGCGIDNLRIADASIMPRITSRNIMTPCVVIGERAAQVLMADLRSDPRQPSA